MIAAVRLIDGILRHAPEETNHPVEFGHAFNGIFMIARTPGLIAHVIEKQTREKPMRRIDPVKHGYDGPAPV